MKNALQKQNEGFALLLTLIISSVVLAIGLSILNISINQINLSATARESELAFQSSHAGVDCLWYWRNERSSVFTNRTAPAPSINCFDGTTVTPPVKTALASNSNGFANSYQYRFQWGEPARCTEVNMHVINAQNGNMSLTFTNEGIGNNGVKTCNRGNVCTIIVSSGYNRACNALSTSIFSVQREITVEF